MSRLSAAEKIARRLPEEFTRQDVLEQAKSLNYSYSTANASIQKMKYMGLAESIGNGRYRKLETTFQHQL